MHVIDTDQPPSTTTHGSVPLNVHAIAIFTTTMTVPRSRILDLMKVTHLVRLHPFDIYLHAIGSGPMPHLRGIVQSGRRANGQQGASTTIERTSLSRLLSTTTGGHS